jgi:hypothetical protein
MSNVDKILTKMQTNPRDWRIENVKTVAKAFGLEWRQQGTSHVVFFKPDFTPLTIPAKKPIKPIYIKKFVALIKEIEGNG